MESKKIIIMATVLFLIGGLGTFVFAGKPNDITPEDINYSKPKTDTKVNTPVINSGTNNNNNSIQKPSEDLDDSKIDDIPNNDNLDISGSESSTSTKVPINVPGTITTKPKEETNKPGTSSSAKPDSKVEITPPATDNSSKPVEPEQDESNNNDNNDNNDKPIETENDEPTVKPDPPVVIVDTTAPDLKINYSTIELTNFVTVTITANEKIKEVDGWNLSNNGFILTKDFTANDTGEVTVYDLAGNASKITYSIDNIDNIKPTATVATSNNNGQKKTFRNILVTITADEDIREVDGWHLENNRVLTKTFGREIYSADVKVINKELTITDLAGNETEIFYEIKNYNPDLPEVVITKEEDIDGNINLTVSQIFNKPLDETWQENENGEYIKENKLTNGSDFITITLPDGTIQMIKKDEITTISPDGVVKVIDVFNVEVDISNYNTETKKSTPTNKPVTVTIKANREIFDLEEWQEKGWQVLDDKKSLTKDFSKATDIIEEITDCSGDKVIINKSVSNIDMTPAEIRSAEIDGDNIQVRTDDFISLPIGWKSNKKKNIKIVYKPISEFIQKGNIKEATIELNDRFGNISKYKVIINSDNTVITEKIG